MTHSESDTRSKLIDPSIKDSGWLESKDPLDGLQQSINYAQRLKIDFVYATNGHKIYEHSLVEGKGSFIENYPTDLCFKLNIKTRAERVLHVEDSEFIPEQYKKDDVKELDEDKLGKLVDLSGLGSVRNEYFELQREIYKQTTKRKIY